MQKKGSATKAKKGKAALPEESSEPGEDQENVGGNSAAPATPPHHKASPGSLHVPLSK